MAYGASYYMSFPRTMDPSLRWDDEFYYVVSTPKQTPAPVFHGPIGIKSITLPDNPQVCDQLRAAAGFPAIYPGRQKKVAC
jgi:hypothetical protein